MKDTPNISPAAASGSAPLECIDPASAAEQAAAVRRTLAIATMAFVSMLPVTLLVPALKELVGRQSTGNPMWSDLWAHAFMSVNMIGAIAAAPFLARLSNLHGWLKRVAALALAAEAVLLALMTFAPGIHVLLTLRFFEGAAHILAISTLMGMASAWSTAATRGRTMGIVGAAMMFGTAFGTRLGGVVWSHLPGMVFAAAAVIAGLSGVLALLVVREAPDRERSEGPRASLMAPLRAQPALWTAFAYAFIDRFCVGVIISTFVLFLDGVHGLDPSVRSKLLFMFMLPFATLLYPAGRLVDRIGRIWPLSLGSILFGVAFASYGLVPLPVLHGLMVVSGVLSALMFAPNLALCADLSPVELRGAAFTGFNIAGSLGFVAGPLFGGLCLHLCSQIVPVDRAYAVTLLATGATEVLCGLATLPLLLRLKRRGLTR